jgi:TM2 domain-containing membrane protein YozV
MLAAVFSAFLPGAGHLYTGRIGAAILWFLVVSAGYALVLPGLVLHLFNIVSAASSARRLNVATARLQLTTA